jgi:hypothetical protein|nr:MAG: hypothetical protein [Bacteriophage sp.]UWG00268.1 MAG: hypothetical protein [Bacteriophage sp.]
MSSYLSFYLVPKAHPEERLLLQSFSRSNEVYQRFFDNLSIAHAGNEEKYTKLTVSDVESVIRDLDDDIAKAEARRVEYEKFCHGNSELIEEMISTKEYIRDLQSTRDYISFIRDILADLDYSGFSDVLCNID